MEEEFERNGRIKDRMRETCIGELVESWLSILTAFPSQEKILNLCLNVVASYVSWIDVSLIANERFVPLLVACLGRPETEEAATDAVCNLLSKGMDPVLKVQLVEALDGVLVGVGFFSVEGKEAETLSKVSQLLNTMGTVLVDCWNK